MSETLLPALPDARSLYLKAALTTRRRGTKTTPVTTGGSLGIRGLRLDPAKVEAYNAICVLPLHEVALTYPQVLAAPLHMQLLLGPGYPFPLVGMVHLRNTIEQARPLSIGVPYDVTVRLDRTTATPLGVEVDLVTTFAEDGETVWTATTTALHRFKGEKRPKKAPPAPPPAVAAEYLPFEVPADIGRRYAPVSGDYNPIHLTAASAKLFGFDRAIAHGMWTLARCLGLLRPMLPEGAVPNRLSVQFKQPLLLPARVTLKHPRPTEDGRLAFDLLAREGGRVHLSGEVGTAPVATA